MLDEIIHADCHPFLLGVKEEFAPQHNLFEALLALILQTSGLIYLQMNKLTHVLTFPQVQKVMWVEIMFLLLFLFVLPISMGYNDLSTEHLVVTCYLPDTERASKREQLILWA